MTSEPFLTAEGELKNTNIVLMCGIISKTLIVLAIQMDQRVEEMMLSEFRHLRVSENV